MIGQSSSPDVVLVHDWLVAVRGAERVLDRLARRYGPTDLYSLVHNGRPLTPAIDACQFHLSPLQRLPGGRGSLRRWYLPLLPWMIERLELRSCDLVLSDSSAVAKSVRPPAGVPHLCYCHSPARYIWEQTEDYATGSRGRLRGAGLRMIQRRFRDWDQRTAGRVDRFLANSQHIAQRIERCWDREATVVYPPVRTEEFYHDPTVAREPWFLVVGALEPYKRTDLAIAAAARAGVQLKVVGTGTQFDTLRRAQIPGVEYLGRVPDSELITLYQRAAALVFPQEEDFGIVAVEAQACGCPVIALARGGALEIVRTETGLLVEDQTPEAFADAMGEARRWSIAAGDCRANAERFSCEVFDRSMDIQVREMMALGAG